MINGLRISLAIDDPHVLFACLADTVCLLICIHFTACLVHANLNSTVLACRSVSNVYLYFSRLSGRILNEPVDQIPPSLISRLMLLRPKKFLDALFLFLPLFSSLFSRSRLQLCLTYQYHICLTCSEYHISLC